MEAERLERRVEGSPTGDVGRRGEKARGGLSEAPDDSTTSSHTCPCPPGLPVCALTCEGAVSSGLVLPELHVRGRCFQLPNCSLGRMLMRALVYIG